MEQVKWVDSHCHFDFSEFDADRQALWRQCQDQGIQRLVIPGTHPDQWQSAQALCQAEPSMRYAVGAHPYQEDLEIREDDLVEKMSEHLANPACLAIGECGLDARMSTPMESQIKRLLVQLDYSVEADLPVILHCVKADNELLQCLNKVPSARGVVHAFSGSFEMAQDYIRRGFMLGIGGTITYERANKTRRAIARTSLQHLLLETDAPSMPIEGHQGQRNTPLALLKIADQLATLQEQPLDTVAQQVWENSHTLFNRLA